MKNGYPTVGSRAIYCVRELAPIQVPPGRTWLPGAINCATTHSWMVTRLIYQKALLLSYLQKKLQ